MEPTQSTEQSTEQEAVASPPQTRNFVIPGCEVQIVCQEENGMDVQQLLGIVFNLAASNPDAKVDFWLKVLP